MTMSITTDLTDRYLGAAVKHAPERQRADLERELRASIEDALEPRLDAGEPVDTAERAVLGGLGDPEKLVADWLDRPLHLIGPAVFLLWKKLLIWGLAVLVPITVVAVYLIQSLVQRDLVGPIGDAIGAGLSVAMHVAFWVTLAFAIVERSTDALRSLRKQWTVDDLPSRTPGRGEQLAEGIIQLVAVGALVFALAWQQFNSIYESDGQPVPLFEPSLWLWWWPFAIAVTLLGAIVQLVRRFDLVSAWVNLAGQVLVTVPAVWLTVTGAAFNPEFLERLRDEVQAWPVLEGTAIDTGFGGAVIAIGAILAIGGAWDAVEGFRKARKPRTVLAG